ncbi:MAG: efflux RND transporter periplasmic adaptor subunit [Gemmatimonadetes bacterium]|nr:efflux RND transporter periplasmic adaptor subunit [Gemmatimonadota bacterium]
MAYTRFLFRVLKFQRLFATLALAVFIAAGCGDASSGTGDNANEDKDGEAEADSTAPPPVPVSVISASLGTISDVILTTATVEADRDARIFPRTTAMIEDILVQEGDRVQRGQTLAVLEHAEEEVALARAEAIRQARKQEFDRSVAMLNGQLISEVDHEAKEREYIIAKAEWESAKVSYDKTTITAPFRGTITERHLNVGNMARPGDPLFTLVDLNTLLIYTYLPEMEWSHVAAGQDVVLETDTLPDGAFGGKVHRVSSIINPQNGTFKVTIRINDPGWRLKPGMFVRVKILADQHEDVLLIPKIALLDGNYVFTVLDDSLAVRAELTLGLQDADFVEIEEGLNPGDRIVIAGHRSMKDSTRVKIVTP